MFVFSQTGRKVGGFAGLQTAITYASATPDRMSGQRYFNADVAIEKPTPTATPH